MGTQTKTKALYNIDAEMSLLGAIIISPNDIEMLEYIFLNVKPTDFGIEKHSIIYTNMALLFNKGVNIDIVTLSETLERGRYSKDIKDISYIVTLSNYTPSASAYKHYISIIKDYEQLRRIESLSKELSKGIGEGFSASKLNSVIGDHIDGLVSDETSNSINHIGIAGSQELERIEAVKQGVWSRSGLDTGFNVLDNTLNGLNKSDLIVIGARPGVGKTAFAINLLDYIANESKKQCLFFSLEMAEDQIVNRLISLSGQINNHDLKTGKANIKTVERLIDRLKDGNLYIDDTSTNTVSKMSIKARQHKRKHGLDLIVIDYLQFIQPDTRSGNKFTDIGEIAKGLKVMARQLNVPVVALAQVGRGMENEANERMPRLSDLSDSAEIEKNADIVMFLHPDRGSSITDPIKKIDLIIAKFRNGARTAIKMLYHGSQFRFEELNEPKPEKRIQEVVPLDNAEIPEQWL